MIRRRDSGEEVLRGGAGHDIVWMLDQLQRDLKSMSEESFTAKWRAGTDWTIALRNVGQSSYREHARGPERNGQRCG